MEERVEQQHALAVTVTRSAPSQRSARKTKFELEKLVLEVVQELTGEVVDPDQPLAVQGLDSLAAMELRQKLQVRPTPHCILMYDPVMDMLRAPH